MISVDLSGIVVGVQLGYPVLLVCRCLIDKRVIRCVFSAVVARKLCHRSRGCRLLGVIAIAPGGGRGRHAGVLIGGLLRASALPPPQCDGTEHHEDTADPDPYPNAYAGSRRESTSGGCSGG